MKTFLIIAAIILLSVLSVWWILFRTPPGTQKSPAEQAFDIASGLWAIEKKVQADKDLAVIRAKEIFKQKLLEETDLSSGPCLSEDLIPGWVVDIAHSPREPQDDLPENQCRSYREGRAQHFVELDPYGNVIRIY